MLPCMEYYIIKQYDCLNRMTAKADILNLGSL